MIFIFILSSNPSPERLKVLPIIFRLKIVHIVEYGVLALLFNFALSKTTSNSKKENIIFSIILTIFYGITDEIHQNFVPSRTANPIDVIADGVGAGIFLFGGAFKEKISKFKYIITKPGI